MSNANDYRAKAAEFAALASKATSPKDITEFRQRARAFNSLAENEEWVEANRDKLISKRAPADGQWNPIDVQVVHACSGACHLDRRGHDFVPDVVALEDADAQGIRSHSGYSAEKKRGRPARLASARKPLGQEETR